MDRRSFLRALSSLAISACSRSDRRAAGSLRPASDSDVNALIDERLAERNVDYVSLLERTPHILRRAPAGTTASLRKTLREHPEAAAEMNAFRVSALKRLRASSVEPAAKMLMLDAQLEKVPHAVTTCMEHFVGVHDLLKIWGHPDALALVGLFHAMYGTEYFVLDLLDYRRPEDRVRLRSVVGEQTERWILQYGLMLSHAFVDEARAAGGATAHLAFFETTDAVPEAITPSDFVALAELQVANAYEPFTHSQATSDLDNVLPYAPLRDFVSSGAKDAIDRTLRAFPAK
jgi:hypothetical protein